MPPLVPGRVSESGHRPYGTLLKRGGVVGTTSGIYKMNAFVSHTLEVQPRRPPALASKIARGMACLCHLSHARTLTALRDVGIAALMRKTGSAIVILVLIVIPWGGDPITQFKGAGPRMKANTISTLPTIIVKAMTAQHGIIIRVGTKLAGEMEDPSIVHHTQPLARDQKTISAHGGPRKEVRRA